MGFERQARSSSKKGRHLAVGQRQMVRDVAPHAELLGNADAG